MSKRRRGTGTRPDAPREIFVDGKTIMANRNGKLRVRATVPPSAQADATFVTVSASSDLAHERVLTAGPGITITDNGAGSTLVVEADDVDVPVENVVGDSPITVIESPAKTFNVSHDDSALDDDTYYYPRSITTDAKGHVTAFDSDPFLSGHGLVYGRGAPGRSITSLSDFLCVPSLGNKVFVSTSATTAILYYIDTITKEVAQLATYASKSIGRLVYSPHASSLKLYASYAGNCMSLNPSTGAIVTSGINKTFPNGAIVHPVSGILYGYNATVLNRVDTTTDTAGSNIITSGTGGLGHKCVAYCPNNDSVYIYVNATVSRVSCQSNTEAAYFSPAGLSGATSVGTLAYNATANKIFVAASSCMKLIQINPNVDGEETTYSFPPGCSGTGSSGMISCGDYLYIGMNGASSPSEILIFDCVNLAFIGSLNTLNGGTTTGITMDAVQGAPGEDSFLYTFISSASGWGYFGGRV